jgi:tetratricopeptide (TPR) repeat protein
MSEVAHSSPYKEPSDGQGETTASWEKAGTTPHAETTAGPSRSPSDGRGDAAICCRSAGRKRPGHAARQGPRNPAPCLQEHDEQLRVQLAKEALAISPDCADAYVLLAEHAHSRKEALALYEQGMAAGERALGAEAFQQDVGHFWGILETRPYLRARLGLAHALWTAGRRDEAVQHLQDMLRLNPNDNQGVRYTLAGFLLFLDRDDDLARLFQQYPEETSTAWAYTQALLAFRHQGDTPDAQRLLKEARKTNKHVPAYLLGEKFPPTEQPGHYSPGDESEALNYIGSFLAAWKSTPGAIAWLRANVKKPKESPQARGPLGFIKKWLNKNLPQEFDVWQADFRQMPKWIRVAGQPVRPWTVLVTSYTNDLVLAHRMAEETPSAALLWDTLAQAMQHPAAGEPHRPSEIQVRPDERWESLRRHLEEIGVGLDAGTELDPLGEVFKEMCIQVCGRPKPGLLDMPGVTAEQVASFYEAAALFFQQAPWKKVGYESVIKVQCDKFQSGPWYAILMGQSGLTTGLTLYEDMETLRRMWAGGGDEHHTRQAVGTSVTFGEEWEIAMADFEAAKKYRWQVARPDAYPAVIHKERGLSLRPPLAWELELVEACLRTIPEFVARHQQDGPAREEFTVPVASGQLRLVLSWVVEINREPQEESNRVDDYLLDAVHKQWENILTAYRQFGEQKPIVLFDLQEQRIYVYPYEDFKSEMAPNSQVSLTEQYEKALRENKFVVFVRDNEQQRLVSFSMDYD